MAALLSNHEASDNEKVLPLLGDVLSGPLLQGDRHMAGEPMQGRDSICER